MPEHSDLFSIRTRTNRLSPAPKLNYCRSCMRMKSGVPMNYLIGLILALAVAGFARIVGFDRDRAFYPTVLIVTASYYVLFAAMGASGGTIAVEIIVATVFLAPAVIGYRKSAWFVIAALIGHGVFDLVRQLFITNPGVPVWWPGFCLAFDVALGGLLAVGLWRRASSSLNLNG